MVTATAIIGTAFAIFLIMAVYMVSRISEVEVAPESNRSRILTGRYVHIGNENSNSSGSMSYSMARRLYDGLKGVEKISYEEDSWNRNEDVSASEGRDEPMAVRKVDNAFWDIYDFTFVAGRPYGKTEADAPLPVAVVARSAAMSLFGCEDAVGKEISINHKPYRVVGVVEDVSPLMMQSYARVYVPYEREKESELWMDGCGGHTEVVLLMAPGAKEEEVRAQVKGRYDILSSQLAESGLTIYYHGAPFNSATVNLEYGSNTDPDPDSPRRIRYAVYALLLLLPAINLSGMTRSRLRRRVAEIGVRRAFGATRIGIAMQFVVENLVLTLAGGLAGLLLSMIFLGFFSNLFINYGGLFSDEYLHNANPSFAMMFDFSTFGMALLMCMALNLLSSGMPAWKASRVHPAEAISGKNN